MAGFHYRFELTHADGRVECWEDDNLFPVQAANHMLDVTFRGVVQNPTWYIGVFEGNYTPTINDTMLTLPAAAVESTAYNETVRQTFTPGVSAAGATDNSASQAVFTFNADKTLYGGFISSSNTKSGTAGVLGSVVRFASPKVVGNGSTLKVLAGLTLTSL